MTRSCPYWHIDAFATRPFAGNQAAVLLLDHWPADEMLVAIAAENNFAETAFLVPDTGGKADYELRWFTPTVEVAMCGHATLASGHAMLCSKASGDTVTFRTRRAGILSVMRADAGEGEGYELSLPVTRVEKRDNLALLAALGVAGEVFASVSGAEQTAIVLLENEAAVRSLTPDMRALAQIELMAICTAAGDDGGADIVSRVFVPAWGIEEDSVTGSAHAALVPFWVERLGRAHFTAYQASARGGNLTCRLTSGADGERAVLGGNCVTMVEGHFYLTD